jgi:hypothetical protein
LCFPIISLYLSTRARARDETRTEHIPNNGPLNIRTTEMTKENTLLTSSAHMYQIAINAITFATNHGEIGDPSDLAPAAPVSMSIGKLPPAVAARGGGQERQLERVGGCHETRKLTPMEGKTVEPVSWGKETAEGMWRRQQQRRPTPPRSQISRWGGG